LPSDARWIAEEHDDPESARYWEPYPRSEHEVRSFTRRNIERVHEEIIIAEINREPAGSVALGWESGTRAHSAEIGIFVRREFWGKGVGGTLMKEVIELAKQHGILKLELDTCEGNDRPIALYKKFGFEIEVYQTDRTYVEGTWKKYFWMGAQLAPLEPRFKPATEPRPASKAL
jgi:RimJ/RimL family protein N-acetyltransferase